MLRIILLHYITFLVWYDLAREAFRHKSGIYDIV